MRHEVLSPSWFWKVPCTVFRIWDKTAKIWPDSTTIALVGILLGFWELCTKKLAQSQSSYFVLFHSNMRHRADTIRVQPTRLALCLWLTTVSASAIKHSVYQTGWIRWLWIGFNYDALNIHRAVSYLIIRKVLHSFMDCFTFHRPRYQTHWQISFFSLFLTGEAARWRLRVLTTVLILSFYLWAQPQFPWIVVALLI